MRGRSVALVVIAVTLAASGCASDPTASEEYRTLEVDLAAAQDHIAGLEDALTTVEAERDAMKAELDEAAAVADRRRERALATVEAITAIIQDPSAFGTEKAVLDELTSHVTADAVMDDDVFGAVPMREAWRSTLFGGLDASIREWHRWMSDDGSQGGVLWTWTGTNVVGEPFELIGVSILRYDAEGRQEYQLVVYPYEDDVVRAAITGSGG